MKPARVFFCRMFLSTLAIAIGLQPSLAFALRQPAPSQTPGTLGGLEEAFGTTSRAGLEEDEQALRALRDQLVADLERYQAMSPPSETMQEVVRKLIEATQRMLRNVDARLEAFARAQAPPQEPPPSDAPPPEPTAIIPLADVPEVKALMVAVNPQLVREGFGKLAPVEAWEVLAASTAWEVKPVPAALAMRRHDLSPTTAADVVWLAGFFESTVHYVARWRANIQELSGNTNDAKTMEILGELMEIRDGLGDGDFTMAQLLRAWNALGIESAKALRGIVESVVEPALGARELKAASPYWNRLERVIHGYEEEMLSPGQLHDEDAIYDFLVGKKGEEAEEEAGLEETPEAALLRALQYGPVEVRQGLAGPVYSLDGRSVVVPAAVTNAVAHGNVADSTMVLVEPGHIPDGVQVYDQVGIQVPPGVKHVSVPKGLPEAQSVLRTIQNPDVLVLDAGVVVPEAVRSWIPGGRHPVVIRMSEADAAQYSSAGELARVIRAAEHLEARVLDLTVLELRIATRDYRVAILSAA